MQNIKYEKAKSFSSVDIRRKIRNEQYVSQTSGLAPSKLQTNIVILPYKYEKDFEYFCKINPKACPLVGKTKLDNPFFCSLGENVDVRTDVPSYNIYKNGKLYNTVNNVSSFWQEDLIAFAIGCSFTFEQALIDAGLKIDHIEMNKIVPMYRTNLKNKKSGVFASNMVVSMRIFRKQDSFIVKNISDKFSFAHGSPIHVGDPKEIGIIDISKPDWGDAPRSKSADERYYFWACGVTPQNAILEAKLPFCITHTPGHMLITDIDEKILQY